MSVLFHKFSILIFILMLILSEGQVGEAWDLQTKEYCLGYL
jgi:hypothetical protein